MKKRTPTKRSKNGTNGKHAEQVIETSKAAFPMSTGCPIFPTRIVDGKKLPVIHRRFTTLAALVEPVWRGHVEPKDADIDFERVISVRAHGEWHPVAILGENLDVFVCNSHEHTAFNDVVWVGPAELVRRLEAWYDIELDLHGIYNNELAGTVQSSPDAIAWTPEVIDPDSTVEGGGA